MSPRVRRLALGVGAAALCLLLAAAALVALAQGWQRERLRRALESALAQGLGAEVHLAALEGPLYPALSLRGLRVGPAAAPLLELERASARFELAPWLRSGRIALESLELEGARYVLERSADAGWRGLGLALEGDSAPQEPPGWLPGLEIRRFALRGGQLLLRWRGATREQEFALAVELEGSGLGLPFSPEQAARLAGELRAELVPGPGSARLFERGALALRAAEGRLTLAEGSASGRLGELELRGEAHLAGWLDRREAAGLELSARFRRLDLAVLSGSPELAGELHGEARLGATLAAGAPLEELALELALDAAESRLALAALERASLRARYARGSWRLEPSRLEGEGLSVSARGEGDARSFRSLALEGRVASLARLSLAAGRPGAGIDGELAFEAQLEGPFAAPRGELRLRGQGLRARGTALGDLSARLRGERGGMVRVEELALTGGGQELTLEGGFDAAGFRSLRVRAANLDVGALALLAGSPVELAGRADADLRLDGPFARPQLQGSAGWSEPRIGELSLERIGARVATAKPLLQIEAAVRAEGRESLRAEIELPWDGSSLEPARLFASPLARVALEGEELDLRLLGPWLRRAPAGLRGRARLSLALRGGRPPSGSGSVELAEGAIELRAAGTTLAPVAGRLAFSPHAEGLEIAELSLSLAGQTLEARGVVSAERLHDLRLTARAIDVAALAPLLPGAPALAGIAEGELRLAGPLPRPDLAGALAWEEPRVQGVALERVAAEIEAAGGRARASARAWRAGQEMAVAEAVLPWAAGAAELLADRTTRLGLRADGFDLGLLRPFLPRPLRELAGRADLVLDLRGGEPAPELAGFLDVADASLTLPVTRATWAPIRGRLALREESLWVEDLRIGTEEAGARLAGRISLEGLEPRDLDLALDLEHFPLARSPLLTADASGAVAIGGRLEAATLEGELRLERVSAALGRAADPALREIRVLARDSAGEEAPGVESRGRLATIPDGARVRFDLSAPRNSWIRGPGTELEVEGALELRKAPFEKPALVGTVSAVRGRYTFQTKRFDVERGSLTFDGAQAIDPLLDIEAVHRVRDIRILLFATGRWSDPTLRLASEPPLPESDVLSYLFLGRPADQLAGSGGGGGLDSAAASLAAGVAATEIAQILPTVLPIDTFDIRMAESERPAEVSAGRYVSDRIFVRYGRSFGPEGVDRVRVELRLTDHLSLESDLASDQSAGADLIWSTDY